MYNLPKILSTHLCSLNRMRAGTLGKWFDEYTQLATKLGYPDLFYDLRDRSAPSELKLSQIRAICAYIDEHGKNPPKRTTMGRTLQSIKACRDSDNLVWFDEYDQLAAELGHPAVLFRNQYIAGTPSPIKLSHIRELCAYIDEHGTAPHAKTNLGSRLHMLKKSRRTNAHWYDEYDQLAAELGQPNLLQITFGNPSELKLSQIRAICAYIDTHGKFPTQSINLGRYLNSIRVHRGTPDWHDEYDQLATELGHPDLFTRPKHDVTPSKLKLSQIRGICAYIDIHGKPPTQRDTTTRLGKNLQTIRKCRGTRSWFDEYDQLAEELGYLELFKQPG